MTPRTVVQLLGPSTGGIRRHVAILAEGLDKRGWRSPVAGPAGVMDGVGRHDYVVPVGLQPKGLLTGRRRLNEIVQKSGADLVHAHGLKAGWLAAVSGLDVPVVMTVHNVVLRDSSGLATPMLRLLERALPRRVDKVIAVSNEIAGRLPGPVQVIAPAGPVPQPKRTAQAVRDHYGIAPKQPLVVTVARLHPQKDLDTLLEAAVEVKAQIPDVQFLVVGDGPERARLEERRDTLGLGKTVRFVGYQPNAADEIQAADVVCLSSIWEGSPLVVAETFQLGRPLVATAVGAVPEAIVEGESGRLVPPRDGPALADALVEVLLDPVLASRLADGAQQASMRLFDPELLIDKVSDAYGELLAD